MGKTGLALKLSEKHPEINKTKMYEIISSLLDIIREEVVDNGNKVVLKGFGTFYLKDRKEPTKFGRYVGNPCKYIKFKSTYKVEY